MKRTGSIRDIFGCTRYSCFEDTTQYGSQYQTLLKDLIFFSFDIFNKIAKFLPRISPRFMNEKNKLFKKSISAHD